MGIEFWVLFRLLVSGILSGLIGYERFATGKRAGLRTHILVAVGSTLFVSFTDLTLQHMTKVLPNGPQGELKVEIQPMTAVQAIATGVGFLGAGTIFSGERRGRVHGLTTAASIWATAAVGVAVAMDRFIVAIGSTLLVLFVLHGLLRLEARQDATVTEPPGP